MELNNRGWEQHDIVKRSKMAGFPISQGHLSRIINRTREAGAEACISIAYGLNLPREEVFRARGFLLKEPEAVVPAGTDPRITEIATRLDRIPPELLEQVYEVVVSLLDMVDNWTGTRRE